MLNKSNLLNSLSERCSNEKIAGHLVYLMSYKGKPLIIKLSMLCQSANRSLLIIYLINIAIRARPSHHKMQK